MRTHKHEQQYWAIQIAITAISEQITIYRSQTFIHIPVSAYKEISDKYRLLQVTIEWYNQLLKNEEITIAFGGSFSSGKSTLINKMLGKPYLPTSHGEETGVNCYLRKGPIDKMVLIPKIDSQEEIKEAIMIDELEKYISKTESTKMYKEYEALNAYFSEAPIPDGIVWVDTAGISDKVVENNPPFNFDTLRNSDIVVWVTQSGGSNKFLSEHEQNYLRKFINGLCPSPMLFVANIHTDKTYSNALTMAEARLTPYLKDESTAKDLLKTFIPTELEEYWQKQFTENFFSADLKSIENFFGEYSPIVLTQSEYEELCEADPKDVQPIISLIRNRQGILLESFKFSTKENLTRTDNNNHFDYFQKYLKQFNSRYHPWILHSRMAKVREHTETLLSIVDQQITYWKKLRDERKVELDKKIVEANNKMNQLIEKCFKNIISYLTDQRLKRTKEYENENIWLIEYDNRIKDTWPKQGPSVKDWNDFTITMKNFYKFNTNRYTKHDFQYEDRVYDDKYLKEKSGKSGKGQRLTQFLIEDLEFILKKELSHLEMEKKTLINNIFFNSTSDQNWLNTTYSKALKVFESSLIPKSFNFDSQRITEEIESIKSFNYTPLKFTENIKSSALTSPIYLGFKEETKWENIGVNLMKFAIGLITRPINKEASDNILGEMENYSTVNIQKSILETKENIEKAYNECIKIIIQNRDKNLNIDKSKFLQKFADDILDENDTLITNLITLQGMMESLYTQAELYALIRQ